MRAQPAQRIVGIGHQPARQLVSAQDPFRYIHNRL